MCTNTDISGHLVILEKYFLAIVYTYAPGVYKHWGRPSDHETYPIRVFSPLSFVFVCGKDTGLSVPSQLINRIDT